MFTCCNAREWELLYQIANSKKSQKDGLEVNKLTISSHLYRTNKGFFIWFRGEFF